MDYREIPKYELLNSGPQKKKCVGIHIIKQYVRQSYMATKDNYWAMAGHNNKTTSILKPLNTKIKILHNIEVK